jgi:hypothetical protein
LLEAIVFKKLAAVQVCRHLGEEGANDVAAGPKASCNLTQSHVLTVHTKVGSFLLDVVRSAVGTKGKAIRLARQVNYSCVTQHYTNDFFAAHS